MVWRTAAERMCSPTLLHICGSSSSVHDLVANKELSVSAQELHTLQVSSQETVAQIKAHVCSLTGEHCSKGSSPAPGRHARRGWGYPGPVWVRGSGHSGSSQTHGWSVHGSLAPAGKVRVRLWRCQTRRKDDRLGQEAYAVEPALCQCCAHFGQEGPQCQLSSPP